MKQIIAWIWMPATGAGSTISVKTLTNPNPNAHEVLEITNKAVETAMAHEPLIHYFYIGMLGAAGGLVIKIFWMLLKQCIKPLRKIDK